jgi:hypothetical protein
MKFLAHPAYRMLLGLLLILVLTAPAALAQVAGTNVNMVSGTQWPTGDPFLQRQNEPSMAVSTRNPMHIMAGANDYRTVDLESLLSGGTETGDSWLGLFKSFDGGLTWQSTLLPGCPEIVVQCTDNNGHGGQALQGIYGAASDPVVRAGTNGMFYYAGLAFVRPQSGQLPGTASAIFVARYNDLNNNENIDPIAYIDTRTIVTGGSGQFLDKPSLAVDIPRSGALTCSFNATEPGAGGTTTTVHQSFPAGNVYVAYTDFLAATKDNSTPTHLMFSHSSDCGVTWSTPVQLNTGMTTSQGSAIAINPINGNVYVTWRQFASTGISDAIMIAQSTNAGKTFSAPAQISKFQPFDQGTTGTSFRTNAFPSITTDMFGFVYVAFSARGLGPGGDARVVAAGSIDGTHWTPAIMVDNPKQNATTNPSGRGHQIMPAITFANGRLTILYYDLRFDHYVDFYTEGAVPGTYIPTLEAEGELAPPSPVPSEVFTPYIDDFGLKLRRHTIDLRVLELGIFPTITLGPSVSVSQYNYGCCVNPLTPDIEQYKFNVPNLPLFAEGSEPFLGDYVEVVPSPLFVPSGNGWAYNFTPSVNPLFHATWTDNRDVVPPPDGDWVHYTPPIIAGTTGPQPSIFEPGQNQLACTPGHEGMRNQNIYTAQITGGLVVGAPGNAKPLGTTTFTNPTTGVTSTVPFQRAFAVEAQNVTSVQIFVRFTIANQPVGGTASFLQFSKLTTLDITVPAYSSVSRSVFVTSTNALASITVNVAQISAIGGSVVTNGLSASAVLNADPTNPNISNPNISNPNISNPNISNAEVTDPNISNPNISNPNISNPNISNPNISNPNISNPNISNPNIGNPNIANVSATNPNISNPNISNPDTANPNISNPNISNPNISNNTIEDVIYPMTNNGNTTATYTVQIAAASNPPVPAGIIVQMILNKLYQTPMANQCQLGLETHWVTVSNIINPKLYGPGVAGLGNPDITNPNPTEGSVTLAPGETVYVTLRIQNPELTPAQQAFNPVTAIAPVTVPQAVDTITVLTHPGNPNLTGPVTYPTLAITTASLPTTDQGDPGYSFQMQSIGGQPGADSWSITSSTIPNLTISPSGLLTDASPIPLGPNSVTIQVQDGAGNKTLKTLSIPVNPQFFENTQGQVTDAVVGQTGYSAIPFTTQGGTSGITWTATGLPPGLGINQTTGLISGTPTTANPAGSTVQVMATDSALPPVVLTRQFVIRVGAVIQISPATLPSGTVGVPYSAQLSATGGIGAYQFGVPSPVPGVTVSSSGLVTLAFPVPGNFSFTVTVHDQANPFQTVSIVYAITFAPPPIGNVTFVQEPPNYVGGLPNPNSPIVVHVADGSNSPVAGANVTLSFNGTPACSTATLSGTLTQQTQANGNAFFTDISVDRGQKGYTLAATVQSIIAISTPFTVSGFCASGNLSTARAYPTAALIKGGQVLIAGGQTSTGPSNAADIYDPGSGTVTGFTTMVTGRFRHTATLLNDGTVLIVGGQLDNTGNPALATTAELFNPGPGTFANTANAPNVARSGGHTATLLADGTVLIAGGINSGGSVLQEAEIYNPANQTFTTVGSMNHARYQHTATLLPNGKVLMAGGPDNTAELYDPVAQTFTLTGNLSTARLNPSGTLLSNGKVLVAGGLSNNNTGSFNTAELYNPATGTFTLTSGNLNAARGAHTATLLPDGTVLVAGGFNCPPPSCSNDILGSAEVYNPATDGFTNTGSLITGRWQDAAIALNDGTVLVAGGFGNNNFQASTERYYNTATQGPMFITTTTPGQTGTTTYTNPTGFGGAASVGTLIGFNGILPAGVQNQDYNPLVVSGASFSTPLASTFVNVTTSTFYTGTPYPADFIVDSSNGNPTNSLIVTLPTPTYAVGLNYGALGFRGASSGNITLSNGFVLPLSSLPTAGQTQFAGFVSSTPITSFTYNVTNDDWVLLNMQLSTADVTLPNAIQGTPYAYFFQEQGGVGALTWTATGALPPGMNVSAAGILSGTPTTAGVYPFTVSVTDSSSPQKVAAAVNFTLTVVQQLVVTTTTLPNGTENVPYTATINTTGGTPQIFFSVTQANFPPGLTITQPPVGATSDTLAGTPTLAGIYNFTESVADSGNPQQTASQAYTVTIAPQSPTNLIGSPQGPGIITLTWTQSPSGDIAGYRIQRGLSSGNYNTVINTGNTNSYVDTGLTSGTTYFYVVSAVSASGVVSAVTNEVSVTAP